MIEINLLPGRKKKRSFGPAVSFSGLAERVKNPLLGGAVAAWVVVLAGAGIIYAKESATIGSLQSEVAEIRTDAEHFRTVIEERRRQQGLHDVLVAEFEEIRTIDSERYVWAHVMQEVTQSLPDYTWIVGLEFVPPPAQPTATEEGEADPPRNISFTVNGRTSDIGAYTRFLRQLGNSPWLRDIVPGATSTLVEDDRPIIAFVVTGTYQQADSAFINVAPLEQGGP